MSEACLTLNVIRDSSVDEDSQLPVGVWIHGGGFYQGSGADERYNMSAIVSNANKIGKPSSLTPQIPKLKQPGKPFIAITLNYRLSAWGFLSSREVAESGNTNLGLRDQRLALHWIRENIAFFGGDPDKVTIWGESAGGMSVGYHLTAYGGRDDHLFRGAIMESGGSVSASPLRDEALDQDAFDALAKEVGCDGSGSGEGVLQCLREVSFENLNEALNGTGGESAYWFLPAIDGDFIRKRGSLSLGEHEFVRVPIISGTNTDEGTSFGPTGINTTEQFYAYLTGMSSITSYKHKAMRTLTKTGNQSDPSLPPAVAQNILTLYPDDPSQGIPAYLGDASIVSKGLQWRRTNAYTGDYMMHANRRRQCTAWAETSTPAYCYRFNIRSADVSYISGSAHFEEVAFVFNNIAGLGYHYGKPFTADTPESWVRLSEMMASMWAGFIYELDPNAIGSYSGDFVGWDGYCDGNEVDILFDANANATTSRMEGDTWRQDAIEYINSIADVYER